MLILDFIIPVILLCKILSKVIGKWIVNTATNVDTLQSSYFYKPDPYLQYIALPKSCHKVLIRNML